MRTIPHGPSDPSLILRDGDRLDSCRIVMGGALYGRILFPSLDPAILIPDPLTTDAEVRDCEIVCLVPKAHTTGRHPVRPGTMSGGSRTARGILAS